MARVSAPLVIAKRADGSDVYLYEGATFPEGMAEGEADRLAEYLDDSDEGGKSSSKKSSK